MPQVVPERVPPEAKDWTWVLHQRCPQCSLEAGVLTLNELPMVIRTQAQVWPVVLLRRDVGERPDPQVWSPLEYAAHTRDVLRLFQRRLERMLTEDEPTLADWDPNEAALQGGYHDLEPATVSAEILTEAENLAVVAEHVPSDAAERRGLRSDGAAFTVTTLMQYFVHDLVHHLWDVTGEDTGESVSEPDAPDHAAPGAEVREADEVEHKAAKPSRAAAESPVATAPDPDTAGLRRERPEAEGDVADEESDSPEPPPIQAFAHRHRRVLGIATAMIALALAVLDVVVLPHPGAGGGMIGFVLRWAAPVCWVMIAAVALTWTMALRRAIVNAFAYVAVACWLVYLLARML